MKIASLTPKQWASGQLVQIKPKLRGWLHLAAAPLSLAASIVLVCLAPTTPTKIGSAVYLACSLILFGVSATYHRFYWAPRWEIMWKRLDHSNIFLLIAGTYTPLTIALLSRSDATILLPAVWGGAGGGGSRFAGEGMRREIITQKCGFVLIFPVGMQRTNHPAQR